MKTLKIKIVGTKEISLVTATHPNELKEHSLYSVICRDFLDLNYGFRWLEFDNIDAAKAQFNKFVKQFTPDPKKTVTEKFYPNVGDKLYLQQGGKSYGCVAEVKTPYTVINVTKTYIEVQECDYEWPEKCYYNTMPLKIFADPKGAVRKLYWSNKYGCWQDTYGGEMRDYPLQAHFGNWQYYPYLD